MTSLCAASDFFYNCNHVARNVNPCYQKAIQLMYKNSYNMKNMYKNVLFRCWFLIGPARTKPKFWSLAINTVKWSNNEQFSLLFLNKIEYLNHMASILQT